MQFVLFNLHIMWLFFCYCALDFFLGIFLSAGAIQYTEFFRFYNAILERWCTYIHVCVCVCIVCIKVVLSCSLCLVSLETGLQWYWGVKIEIAVSWWYLPISAWHYCRPYLLSVTRALVLKPTEDFKRSILYKPFSAIFLLTPMCHVNTEEEKAAWLFEKMRRRQKDRWIEVIRSVGQGGMSSWEWRGLRWDDQVMVNKELGEKY